MVIYLYCFLAMTFTLSAMQEPQGLHPSVTYRANPRFFIQNYIRINDIKALETFLKKKEVINELKEDKGWILNETKKPEILAVFLKKNVLSPSDIYLHLSNNKGFTLYEIESYKTLMKPCHVRKYEKIQEHKILRRHISRNEVFDFLWEVDGCTDQTLGDYLKDESISNFIQKEECLFPLALRQIKDSLKLKVLIDHGINLKYEYTSTIFHEIADKPYLYHYDFLYALIARYIFDNHLTTPKKVAFILKYMLDQERFSAFDRAEKTYKICQKKPYEKGEKDLRISIYLAGKDPEYYWAFTRCLEETYKERASHNIMKRKYENNSTYLDYHYIYPWRNRKKALTLLNPATWIDNQQLFDEIQQYQKKDK